jgi:uncharacterized membrane protein
LKRIKVKIRTYFATGLLVALPLFVTIWFVGFLLNILNGVLKVPSSLLAKYSIPGIKIIIPTLGILIILILITGIGIIATNIAGRKLITLGETLLSKLPLINIIYTSVKQFLEAIFVRSKSSFSQVVLVEYPRKGIYSIGFITCDSKGEIQNTTKEDLINIFVPTTPNPTSGMLVMVPKDRVIPLNMSIEEGLKFIISGGIISPKEKRNAL